MQSSSVESHLPLPSDSVTDQLAIRLHLNARKPTMGGKVTWDDLQAHEERLEIPILAIFLGR